MANTPPRSPIGVSYQHQLPSQQQRPFSAIIRPTRSDSRNSSSSKRASGSRASDDDGKTAVKVAVRVRPPLKPADPGYDLIPQRFQRSIAHVTSPTSLTVESPQGRKLFVFDRVFGEDVTQDGIWEYVSESIDAFVQGYNVSVLAYGQSGSGKSYTMGTAGPHEQVHPEVKGIIPRAAASLFEKLGPSPPHLDQPTGGLRAPQRYSMLPSLAAKTDDDKNWTMHATYVEIYNEQLRDLLVPESIPLSERSAVIIREDVKGRILLTGLHQVAIKTVHDLLGALNFGSSIRQTDATAINAKSSRSHAIFSLNLIQRKGKGPSPRDKRRSVPVEAMTGAESWITVDSKLHFVDLAGSERLKLTGAQGERAREGISINAGLASLGKVISQLSSRQAGSHVSYRDSKLTRVLQDSLGGNALTYMVACVTPTEFHLSETLNTVQYAQRARAIQSKPQIQQVSDEGDKQAVIDRLRAEIAFLRERIHSSERSPRPTDTPQSRNERLQEREADLQNQLLDLQESYFNLGQRHAKLLAEVAKAQEGQNRDGAAENENGTAHALERLKRSNSFAEAVEQVLLEYEKTIQSLETSLAQTRSSLSATESELLEKETKCAYTETVNRQLEARVQKMMEREASTEHYLTDLEAKLSGHTSGEEKNAALVLELRKEIARVRESEANCEDYISTLEERLAEADQDAELMQREIERLEHVVERQRSLGRLELLMQELDQTQQRPKTPDLPTADVVEQLLPDDGAAVAEEQVGAASVHGGDHVRDRLPSSPPRSDKTSEGEGDILPPSTPAPNAAYSVPSPAQTDFVVEKLETVTQELLDLRVEHETTINEFELLAAKYEEALRTISQLQEGVDETRHPTNKDVFTTPASTRPSSFLGGARVSELKEDTQFSSSRSLSLELFSAGESPNISEPSDADAHPPRTHVIGMPHAQLDTQPFLNEIAHLKRLQLEKDEAMSSLEGQYEQLREQHHAVLDEVEELKTEVSKAKMNGAIGAASPIIRRKSSQGVMMVDRAHRSFASLRNIATENLEDRPDVMQSFEINLNAAMHELYARSERVQELEAEITSIKKEMEAKMTIISGLTRERSSLKKTSPMDMSMMSSMRDQLLENENKIRVLQETQEVREKTLLAEIDELRALLDGVKAPLPAPAAEPAAAEVTNSHQQDHKILELQGELEKWKSRHQATVESMQASESKLLATIKEMEEALEAVQSRPPATLAAESDDEKYRALQKAAEATLEHERTRHQEIVMSLQQKVEEYASSIDAYARRVEDLEHTGNESRRDLEERLRMAESTEKELESHRALVSLLERRIADHEATIRAHEEELISAKEAHAHELEELQNSTTGLIEARLSEQTSAHQALISSLQGEVTEARDEMGRLLQGLAETLGAEVAAEKVQAQVQALVRQRADVNARLRALQEQTEKLQGEKRTMKATITELTTLNEASVKEIERLNEEYQKSSRLVEELEEQLTTNFDQHQIASNRLSLLESEHLHRFEELVTSKNQALADLEAAKEEITRLEAKLYKSPTNGTFEEARQRSASVTSNLHKSTSVASLPSPPPAIPLPPLPTNATAAPPPPGTPLGAAAVISRTTSRELSSPQPPPPPPDEHENRIRSVENALHAEKQLNFALEEALADLENQSKKAKEDLEAWKKKAWAYEDEIETLKNSQRNNRLSMQAVEEARIAHRKAEAARAQLEERMNALNKKKKKSSLNCF